MYWETPPQSAFADSSPRGGAKLFTTIIPRFLPNVTPKWKKPADSAKCWESAGSVWTQPLTPPAVRPLVRFFSMDMKRMTTGTMAKMEEANRYCHSIML